MVTVDPMPSPATLPARADVVIVGAGPVGLCAAILLAGRGLRSIVLERHDAPYPQPRAVHLDDEVLRILDRAGVGADFRRISRPGKGLRLVDARLRTLAMFRRSESADRSLPAASMFHQPDLELLLRSRVADLPEIHLACGYEYDGFTDIPGGVRVRAHRTKGATAEDVDARYLLGCDGARSTVRDHIGARMQDLGFDQRWVVMDVEVATGVRSWGGVDQVFDAYRAGTYMQIDDRRHRWEFRLRDGERGADFADPHVMRAVIRPWLDDPEHTELTVIRCVEYAFRAMISDRWRRGRVFLAGDAAHVTPPFVGQGLGSGLRDVANLSWKLAAHAAGAPDEVLDTYAAERAPHTRALILRAVMIGRAMTSTTIRARALRTLLLPRAERVPGLSTLATSSVTPALVPSRLVWGARADRRGMLFPYEIPGGATAGGCLVETSGRPDAALARLARRHGLLWVSGWRGPAPSMLRRWSGGRRFLLVRPDGTVAAGHRGRRRAAASIARYAATLAPAATADLEPARVTGVS